MASGHWIGLHVYYHDRQDRLLREGIRPLVAELLGAGLVKRHFFIRHWQGGPHVRLRLLPTGRAGVEVRGRAEWHLAEYLGSSRSTVHIGEREYAGLASTLAAIEREDSGVARLRPDNSVEFSPYRPDHSWIGGAGQAVERNFMESSEIAFELVSAADAAGQRHGQALAMLLVAAAARVGSGGALVRYFDEASRSWASTVFGAERPRHEVEFERQYKRHRERVCRLVTVLLEAMRSDALPAEGIPLRRWADGIGYLARALEETNAAGWAVDRTLAYCVHLHNNRLGVAVQQEAYLLFAIGRALRDVLGVAGRRRSS